MQLNLIVISCLLVVICQIYFLMDFQEHLLFCALSQISRMSLTREDYIRKYNGKSPRHFLNKGRRLGAASAPQTWI